MKRTDALFFDLGDTLVDLRGLVPAMTGELQPRYPALGEKADAVAIRWVRGTAEGTRRAHLTTFRPGIEIAAIALLDALGPMGITIDVHTATEIVRDAWKGYLQNPKFCSDVDREFLLDLRSRVRALGLVTDSDESMVRPLLARLQLETLFDTVVVSETVGAYKPDRRIYLEALALARGRAETSLFVSDSELDLAGAASVGMGTVLIARSANPDRASLPPKANVLKDLQDLPKVLGA